MTWIMYAPVGTLPTLNVNGFNAPLAVKVHVAGLEIIVADVGLEIP
jgi:hypothetical protein